MPNPTHRICIEDCAVIKIQELRRLGYIRPTERNEDIYHLTAFDRSIPLPIIADLTDSNDPHIIIAGHRWKLSRRNEYRRNLKGNNDDEMVRWQVIDKVDGKPYENLYITSELQ